MLQPSKKLYQKLQKQYSRRINLDLRRIKKVLENLFGSGLDTIRLSLYDGPHQVDDTRGFDPRIGPCARQPWASPEACQDRTVQTLLPSVDPGRR